MRYWLQRIRAAFVPQPGTHWFLWAIAQEGALRKKGLERAAQHGHTGAMVERGRICAAEVPAGGASDQAAAWYQAAAEAGDAEGAYLLAETLCWRWPGSRGQKAAFRWYARAADQGWAPAMRWLSHAYAVGAEVEKDLERSAQWAERAAQSEGRVPAVTEEAPDPPPEPSVVRRGWDGLNAFVARYAERPWYPLALAGVLMVTVYSVLGYLGFPPTCGLLVGSVVFIILLWAAFSSPYRRQQRLDGVAHGAGKGQPASLYRLGCAYRDGGYEVPRERSVAARYFLQAAELGHPPSMMALADLLRWGLAGEAPNPVQAEAWEAKARAAGWEPEVASPEPTAPPSVWDPLRERRDAWRQEGIGQRASLAILACSGLILLVALFQFARRNASWFGHRDENRVVWGDFHQKVAAPKDASTRPIPAEKRVLLPSFTAAPPIKGQGPAGFVFGPLESFRPPEGEPCALVIYKGAFPAFAELLDDMQALRVQANRNVFLFAVAHMGVMDLGLALMAERAVEPPYEIDLAEAERVFGDLRYTPITLLVDAQGRVRQRWEGYQPGLLKSSLEEAFNERP